MSETTKSKALAKINPSTPAADWNEDQTALIKSTVAKGATDDELKLFFYTCTRTGLDPLTRQIYFQKRRSKNAVGEWIETMTIQTGIDGYRAIAVRTGQLAGIDDPIFDKEEGQPNKATVTVWRMIGGSRQPFTASARWSEYVQLKNNAPTYMWAKMPFLMLGKCAEALALRKAFPNDLSGIYTAEEMAQADNMPATPVQLSGSVTVETFDSVAQKEPAITDTAPQEQPESEAAKQMRAGQAGAYAPPVATMVCPFCSSSHTGQYPKCRDCWKAERDGAVLVPAGKKKTLINHDAPPF